MCWLMTMTLRASRCVRGTTLMPRQRWYPGLVNDALAILDAVVDIELDDNAADAVGLLALVAGQDVEPGDDEGTWRIFDGTAKDRVISTVDPEARHMHKSVSQYRDGYKAHIAIEPETGIITASTLTAADAADGPVGVELLDGEGPGLQVLADSAYGSGETRAALREAKHTQAIKPIPLARPKIEGGYDRDDFTVDHDNRTVTCPAGHTVTITERGVATFGRRCRGCPLRSEMHDRQRRPDATRLRPRRRTRCCPPTMERQDIPRRLPPIPAHGRTLHRVDRHERAPTGPLPRRRNEPDPTRTEGRRDQPSAARQPGPQPHRRSLGNHLTRGPSTAPSPICDTSRHKDTSPHTTNPEQSARNPITQHTPSVLSRGFVGYMRRGCRGCRRRFCAIRMVWGSCSSCRSRSGSSL